MTYFASPLWQKKIDTMIFTFIIETSILIFSLRESSNSAVSAISFNQDDDVPLSDHSTMRLYDKDFKKDVGFRHKNYYQRPQRNGKIQYAPLAFEAKGEEILTTYYKKTTMPVSTEITKISDIPEISTEENNNFQPKFNNQYNTEYKNKNKNEQPQQPYLSEHNIKVLPKINEIMYQSEKNPGIGNIGYSDRDNHINIRSNNHKSHPNSKLSEPNQEMCSFPRNAITDCYKSQKIFERFHQKHKPIKHIIQVLPALESAKIQPILNPYQIKGSRLHINMARALKIAHGQNKAPEPGHRKRIRINKLKHFVPDIDELLKKKSFLSPKKNYL